MSENAIPSEATQREHELRHRDSKPAKQEHSKEEASRRVLQDVSNNARKEFALSANFGKRPRSESMEIIEESALEKKTRPGGHDNDAEADTAVNSGAEAELETEAKADPENTQPLVRQTRSNCSPSFVVRVALDPTVSPKPLYGASGSQSEDLDDDLDPQMCGEYARDIYAYMYETQEHYMVNPGYIESMPAGHRWYRNRNTLLNWLLTVHRKFRLVAETLYLATNMIDRFLSRESIGLDQVQLLAASALFVASKYEEVMTPAISNFAYVANATVEDIRSMEQRVLVVLEFDLGYPCPLNFLRRISRADDYDMRTRTVAKFMLEMSLFEPRLMVFRPSDVAAASMYVARQILGMGVWSENFIYYSGGCTEDGLQPIVEVMTEYLQEDCEKRDPEFVRQYMSKKVLKAALLAIRWARGEYETQQQEEGVEES